MFLNYLISLFNHFLCSIKFHVLKTRQIVLTFLLLLLCSNSVLPDVSGLLEAQDQLVFLLHQVPNPARSTYDILTLLFKRLNRKLKVRQTETYFLHVQGF